MAVNAIISEGDFRHREERRRASDNALYGLRWTFSIDDNARAANQKQNRN